MSKSIDDWKSGWKHWRRISDESPNMEVKPWSGAVGIEEVDDELAVPGIVCWFCRGDLSFDEDGKIHIADHVIALHNSWIDARDQARDDRHFFI
jgi:hypothetical protein